MAFDGTSQRGNALLQNAYSVGSAGLYDDAGATVEAQQTAYRLNVDATGKYLNASGTWTDPNAIGAAGHSGGPLFVTQTSGTELGKAFVAGNFTSANATGQNGAAGNPGGVGGMLLRPHEKHAIDNQLKLAGYEADDLPKDVIQGSDQNDAGPQAARTYSESFVPARPPWVFQAPIIYANAGNDVVDGYKGDDEIYGDDGYDALFGGLGDDTPRRRRRRRHPRRRLRRRHADRRRRRRRVRHRQGSARDLHRVGARRRADACSWTR